MNAMQPQIQQFVKVPLELLTAAVGLIQANPSPVVPVGQIIEVLTQLQKCESIVEMGAPDKEAPTADGTPAPSGASGQPENTAKDG